MAVVVASYSEVLFRLEGNRLIDLVGEGEVQIQRLEEARRRKDNPRRGTDKVCPARRKIEGYIWVRGVKWWKSDRKADGELVMGRRRT